MITVFGSLNSDFIVGVKNLPLPGETVLCPSYEIKPGGKGANQAAAAGKVGAKVTMFGTVGKDSFGKMVKERLSMVGVDVSGVMEIEAPTAVAVVMVDDKGENSIVVASGANLYSKADNVPDEALSKNKLLVLQMEVNHEENFKLLKRAKKLGAKTLLNVAPFAPVHKDILPLIDYLILNEIEAEMLAKDFAEIGNNPTELVKKISSITQGVCIITLGKEGAIAAANGGEVIKVGVIKIKPVDTTGAGDAFVGIFSAAIDEGLSLEEALRQASIGASLACLAKGAQESLPTKDCIRAHLI